MSECITGMNRNPKTKIEHIKGVYFSGLISVPFYEAPVLN